MKWLGKPIARRLRFRAPDRAMCAKPQAMDADWLVESLVVQT
jgi:hypothetical protein